MVDPAKRTNVVERAIGWRSPFVLSKESCNCIEVQKLLQRLFSFRLFFGTGWSPAHRLVLRRLSCWLFTWGATREQMMRCCWANSVETGRPDRQVCTAIGVIACFQHGPQFGCTITRCVPRLALLLAFNMGPNSGAQMAVAPAVFAPAFRTFGAGGPNRSEQNKSVGPRSSFWLAFNTARDRGTTEALSSDRVAEYGGGSASVGPRSSFWLAFNKARDRGTNDVLPRPFSPPFAFEPKSTRSEQNKSVGPRSSCFAGF